MQEMTENKIERLKTILFTLCSRLPRKPKGAFSRPIVQLNSGKILLGTLNDTPISADEILIAAGVKGLVGEVGDKKPYTVTHPHVQRSSNAGGGYDGIDRTGRLSISANGNATIVTLLDKMLAGLEQHLSTLPETKVGLRTSITKIEINPANRSK